MVELSATEPVTDEELMTAFVQGRNSAFDHLVNRYAAKLTNFIHRQVCDFGVAEDLAQEALLAVYCKKHTFKPGYRFSPWLYKIAINLCRMYFRKKKSRPTTFSIDDKKEVGHATLTSEIPDDREGPLEQLQREDMERKLLAAVGELPLKQRVVFTLSFYEGKSYDEIADLLGCSPGTVASRKHAAVGRLAATLRRLRPAASAFGEQQRTTEPPSG